MRKKHSLHEWMLMFDYWPAEDDVKILKSKLVCTRKVHTCVNYTGTHEIPPKTHALYEVAIVDDCIRSCYTCTDCIDIWLRSVNYDKT